MTTELFSPSHESLTRIPKRPLGSISDYVVEGLPQDLASIREGYFNPYELKQEGERLIGEGFFQALEVINNDETERDLALLDLLMMETGIAHTGIKPGENLMSAVDVLAERNKRIPVLTYEDVVMINPLNNDPRTFSDEENKQTEIDFYLTHAEIEDALEVVIERMISAKNVLVKEGPVGIASAGELLSSAVPGMEVLHQNMQTVAERMDKEKFAAFRPYFNSHPFRTIHNESAKGPSGAFSARVPIVDLLLSGDNLPLEFSSYLLNNRPYFPRKGQEELDAVEEQSQQDGSLLELFEDLDRPRELEEPLVNISMLMKRFRGKHYRGVQNQLPDVFERKGAGSTGEVDVPSFLKGRIRNIHHIGHRA